MSANPQHNNEVKDAALLVRRDLFVKLSAAGNIDRGQNPYAPVFGVPNGHQAVGSLGEASLACRDYINSHGLGSGNWTGGEVMEKDGAQVARISYNGRVWTAAEAVATPAQGPASKSPAKAKKLNPGLSC